MDQLKKKLARRQETERQERRDRILEAARTVFFKKGYLGATIRDIAYEAALSPGLIYHYFDNKDDIYGAICEEAFKVLIGLVQNAHTGGGAVMERLVSLSRAYIGFYRDHNQYFEIISFKELGFKKVGLSPEILKRLNRLSRQSLEPIHTLVEEGLATGIISPVSESWELTMALWAAIEGVIFIHKRGYLETLELQMDRIVNLQLMIIENGIRQAP
jgi:AcrR family transcriptional regulator